MKAKQIGFKLLETNNITHFGGDYLKNSHAKTRRPLSSKRAIHLVLRSSYARGSKSLIKFDRAVWDIVRFQAKVFGVRIYRYANAGNHLHLIILPHSRIAFNRFIRSITGLIARLVLAAERGAAKGIQFWDKRPFTRIVSWGREFNSLARYIAQNTLEAYGFVEYKSRSPNSLAKFKRARSTA